MVGLKINGILDLIKYRIILALQIMRLKFREVWWLFKVTWLYCCLCRLEESWKI